MTLDSYGRRALRPLEEFVLGYITERSKVSSQHKLPTLDEVISVTEKYFDDARHTVEPVIKGLLADGRLIQYDCYYSTEPKETL
jgi:hypothetical protein